MLHRPPPYEYNNEYNNEHISKLNKAIVDLKLDAQQRKSDDAARLELRLELQQQELRLEHQQQELQKLQKLTAQNNTCISALEIQFGLSRKIHTVQQNSGTTRVTNISIY